MIEVKNLTTAYGNFVAVKDVSFKAENGSILGFLGPNGAGKTTTMRIITGYMPAPLGPRKPRMEPFSALNDTSFTATKLP